MIEEILPAQVASAEAFTDPPDATLFPEEEAALGRAVEKRRREFTTARLCARRALAELGVAPLPVVPGPRGEPQWPAHVTGSMTHCAGYRASAVARTTDFLTVGIDAEPHAPLPEGVLDTIALPEELAWIRDQGTSAARVCWDRLLFSAKETVYKAWFPLTRRWLDFEEAAIIVFPQTGTFAARLLVPGPLVAGSPLTVFHGRWLVRDGLVLTAIALPARPQVAGSQGYGPP